MKATHLVVAMLLPAAILSGCETEEEESGSPSYTPRASCSQWPHLATAPDGRCFPEPGYAWNRADSTGSPTGDDFTVHWQRGMGYWQFRNLVWPHIEASDRVGVWYPVPGYVWTHLDANGKPIPGDFTVRWSPGLAYWKYGSITEPHVVADAQEGSWTPENGYKWAHPDASNDLAVIPLPQGTPEPAAAAAPVPQPSTNPEESPPLAQVDPQSLRDAVQRVAGQQVFQQGGGGLTPQLIATNSDTFFRALGEELAERHLPSWNADFPLIKLGTLSLDQIGQRIGGDRRWTRLASASDAQQAADAGGIVLGIVRAAAGQGGARLAVVMPGPGDDADDGAPFILDGNERLYESSDDEATRAARGGAVRASDAWQSLADWQWYALVR